MTWRRRDLLLAIALRELNASFVLLSAGAAVAGFLAASAAADLRASGALAPLVGRLIVRFDLTALFIITFLTALRIAHRAGEDQSGGWLAAWRGNGGDVFWYGCALCAAAWGAGVLLFASAAVSFALGVLAHDGSAALLHAAPALLAAGALMLAAHAAFAGAISTALREPLASIFCYAALAFGPPLLLMIHLLRTDGAAVPLLLAWSIALLTPPITPPAGAAQIGAATLFTFAFTVVAAHEARRLVGRVR